MLLWFLTRFWSDHKDRWLARPHPGGWRRWRMAACSSPSWPGSPAVCPSRGRSSGQNWTAPSPRVRAQNVAKTLHKIRRRFFMTVWEMWDARCRTRTERDKGQWKKELKIEAIFTKPLAPVSDNISALPRVRGSPYWCPPHCRWRHRWPGRCRSTHPPWPGPSRQGWGWAAARCQ